MGESTGFLPLKSQQPFIQLLVSLITLLAISTLLLILTLGVGRLIFGPGMADIDLSGDITSSQGRYLGFIQAMSQISIFLVPGVFISWLMTGDLSTWQGFGKKLSPHEIFLVIFVALSVIPLTTIAGIFNSHLSLPQSLSRLEDWMMGKEEEAMRLTGQLIYASNPWRLILNILILAVIPALGEEIFFRGVLQQIFQKWFRSGSLAIVFTALLFSALHLQFYGFLPRFILGLLYGSIFLWSGSIWLPIIAHFVNNMIPVFGAYYLGWENLNNNLGGSLPSGITSLVVTIVLPVVVMILIRDRFQRRCD